MISCCNFTLYLIDKHKIIIENTSKKCANVCNKRLRKNKLICVRIQIVCYLKYFTNFATLKHCAYEKNDCNIDDFDSACGTLAGEKIRRFLL